MAEQIVRFGDRAALEKIRAKGSRILHRFGNKAILSKALTTSISGVSTERAARFSVPRRLDPDKIGELAFVYRRTRKFRDAKRRRADEGVSMEKIIEGTTD